MGVWVCVWVCVWGGLKSGVNAWFWVVRHDLVVGIVGGLEDFWFFAEEAELYE